MGRARRRCPAPARPGSIRGARDALTAARFAGRFGPGDADRRALERALRPDGGGTAHVLGGLALAATADVARAGPVACVIDGRPDTHALAAKARIDPAQQTAELVAGAYARVGDTLLDELGGEFALVLWDAGARRGLIARDRNGSRPLFVAEHGARLLFASEVRNLLELMPARPDPDAEALGRWLARAPLADDRTLFAGIRRLPPGHAISLEGERWQRVRYWDPAYAPPQQIGPGDAAAEVRATLGRAVDRSLASARRPAVMLSGGLDSAAVAALGRASLATAYSGVFPDHPEVDESDRIRLVRTALDLPAVELELGAGSALDAAVDFIRAWRLPPLSPNRFVWAPLYRRAAADGIDVMLAGDGGDELFGCSYYLIADHLMRARAGAALRTARRVPGMGADPHPRWIARALANYGVRGALPLQVHERLRGLRGRSRGADWLAEPVRDGRWDWKRRRGPRWWAHLVHVLVDDPFGTSEQISREADLHGIGFRRPLLDPDLVDLVLRLPPELAFDAHVDRPLARRALAGDLPAEVLRDTRKPAFNALLEAALNGPDHHALRDLLTNPAPPLAEVIRGSAAAALLDANGLDRRARALDCWRIATAELWIRDQFGA